ncbi:MAG: hypothetical protein ACOYMW_00320 [Candidatus Competibacteraceae bacterium]
MPTSFPQRLFNDWLAQNRSRFSHPPMAIHRRKDYLKFRFTGVDPSVWGQFTNWGSMVIGVDYWGECWDLVADLDIAPERLATGGYICQFCDVDTRTIYPSREAIWIEHGFEPLLEWCNQQFQADQWASVWGDEGATWVQLGPLLDDAATAKPEFLTQYPLLCG